MRLHERLKYVWRLLPKLVGIALLGLIILWMSYGFGGRVGPGESKYPRPALGDRRVVPVRRVQTIETMDAVGTVRPRRRSELASRVLATIQEITVNPGDRVASGQVLVRLDNREIQAQLREAQAAASGARADLAVRQRDYVRYQKMVAEKAVTKEEFDRIEGAYQISDAQTERAEQQVERVEVMLTYATITAQDAGVISDRYADPGDLAVPGKPLLAIHDPGELELHASVRESLAAHLQPGMKLAVNVDAAGLKAEGVVREIVPQAEAASRSVLVKVTLPHESKDRLYMGMFGRLEVPVGALDRVVVHAEALQSIGQLDLVDVVVDAAAVERRYVRVGQRVGDDVEILSGLRVDESVALPALAAGEHSPGRAGVAGPKPAWPRPGRRLPRKPGGATLRSGPATPG